MESYDPKREIELDKETTDNLSDEEVKIFGTFKKLIICLL